MSPFNEKALELAIYYFNERERIRQKKVAREPLPWTDDPILQQYSFTNILRRHDRTSQYLIDEFYKPHWYAPFEDVMLNCCIFRYFGSTTFAAEIGWSTAEQFHPAQLVEAAQNIRHRGLKPFTCAYVITNMGLSLPKEEVVAYRFVAPFAEMLPSLKKVWEAERGRPSAPGEPSPPLWRPMAEWMVQNLNGFGPFMAKEVLQDATYTHVLDKYADRFTWTPIGPGSIRGMNRMLGLPLQSTEGKKVEYYPKLMQLLLDNAETHMGEIIPEFDLHCVQFMLCEFDKYCRGAMDGKRPKRRYDGLTGKRRKVLATTTE